jgi:predicted flap endonuclease-1-like 5' DNA nuclease
MCRSFRKTGVRILLPLGAAAVALWWWLRRSPQPEKTKTIQAKAPATSAARPAAAPKPAPPPADDLRRIEGIGPKIAATLRSAGVATYGQLAETDVGRLEEILREGGIRIAFPDTWPEQAALAAAGDWEGLTALQSTLKGGRR